MDVLSIINPLRFWSEVYLLSIERGDSSEGAVRNADMALRQLLSRLDNFMKEASRDEGVVH